MPNINADGAPGGAGGTGFNQDNPAGTGVGGHDANCNFWDDDCAQVGGRGGNGVQGGHGGPGGPGAHGGAIDIEVQSFSMLITLSARGGAGGPGGRGGRGQDGGKGGRGGDGEDCEFGRHGGSGGNGGNAGVGGEGGRGGNGGVIVVRTRNIADGNQSSIDISAGVGGRGGDPGNPGNGGAPGNDGSTTGSFSASSDCEGMGPVPNWGNVGGYPTPTTLGNGQNGNPGTAQFLQIS